jgi:hypothetical protein
MKIKGKLHTFKINHKSDNGEDYEGTFACRKQSIIDHSKISRRKSELSGGMYTVKDEDGNPTGQGIDEETETINHIIATLEQVLVQKPDWWDLTVLDDYKLITSVFSEVQKFEASFRGRRGSGDSDTGHLSSSEGSSEEERAQSNAANNAPKVVDKKVSTSLDA